MTESVEIKELIDNIYMTGIKLPNNPLKEINIYIIKGLEGEKSMIIDTGFNRPETIQAFEEIFNQLDLTFDNTDLFLTHLHSDHTGLASYFSEKGMKVYASDLDAKILNNSMSVEDQYWKDTIEQSIQQGLEEDNLDINDHPGYKYRPLTRVDYEIVSEGQEFKLGGYNFKVVDFRGHTPGIVGLYDIDKKVLFCGDHILKKITPNITYWGKQYGDSLGNYFKSLDKAYELEVDHLYSSHRALIDDHRQRIDEIRKHHQNRLDEVIQSLKKAGKANVRTVTKEMHWDISSRNWDEFPKSQKWFAAGEAHAHLDHLVYEGLAQCTDNDGIMYYSLK